jgi:putative tryptophan/tyrosine transport system substrate-binding protein
MEGQMKRREFTRLLGGGAAQFFLPLFAHAQTRGKVARIGFLSSSSAQGMAPRTEAIRAGMRELGYVEGSNLVIEYRYADGDLRRLPELAAGLVRANVDVIVTHGTPGSQAAKQATVTIPIVMATVGDPVAVGLVASVARPGGNVTGQSFFTPELMAKRIEMLKELNPQTTRIANLSNPDNAASEPEWQAIQAIARSLKVGVRNFPTRGTNEFESAFDKMVDAQMEAVATSDDTFIVTGANALAMLATKRRLPMIGGREIAQAGGLIGYGVNFNASFRRAAVFVDKILKGTRPADLPIEQATKFEFILNLKTAKTLGIDPPTATLLRADEVIE